MIIPPCRHCKEQFGDWITFDRHLKAVHNKIKILTCKVCNEKCKGVDKFDQHLQFTHGTNHWDINLAMKDAWRQFDKLLEETN
jgi:hypothetical protein